jgi:NADPH-dependent 7-cyano-7-deazaguanine reductase QueF
VAVPEKRLHLLSSVRLILTADFFEVAICYVPAPLINKRHALLKYVFWLSVEE